ncbi:hypothetical protein SVAN01_05638 [Stagonosporopsis vannaccii]|nr:hypothetical protein SVAN01_05638 [Stagonosporopsis vannaccii]
MQGVPLSRDGAHGEDIIRSSAWRLPTLSYILYVCTSRPRTYFTPTQLERVYGPAGRQLDLQEQGTHPSSIMSGLQYVLQANADHVPLQPVQSITTATGKAVDRKRQSAGVRTMQGAVAGYFNRARAKGTPYAQPCQAHGVEHIPLGTPALERATFWGSSAAAVIPISRAGVWWEDWDASPSAKTTGAPIVAITVNATPARERLSTELRRIAAKRGEYWPIDHQPHRLPARAAFSPSRAASWRPNRDHLVGVHSILASASRWRHESRAPVASGPERARGGCTNACTTARRPLYALQSIPEGAASRVPGICERFNGLRDPSMTLALTWRRDYAQSVPHPGPPLEFCDYPYAPARFTLPQTLLRECPAAPSAPGSEASAAAVARPQACV